MRHTIIVVEHAADFRWPVPDDCSVVTASELLNSSDALPHTQFVNLCRKTDYMSVGYYCSLLCRGQGASGHSGGSNACRCRERKGSPIRAR